MALNAPASEREAASSTQDATDAADTRLSELYGGCFSLVLHLQNARGLDDTLRSRVKERLDTAERHAREAGFSEDDVHKASFALVALIDETVHSSNWKEKSAWQNKPLQLERFDRYDAGEEFFAHLEELRAHPEERLRVLEIYYLCLALGFQGRYQLQGQDQLRMLIENTNEQLRRAASRRRGEPIAPHGRPEDQVTAQMQNRIPAWVVAAGGIALAILLYLGMSLYASDEAEEAVQTIEQAQRAQPTQQS